MSPSEALAGLPALVTGGDESVWENCGSPLGRTVGLSIGAGKSLGGCTLARLELGCAEELTSGRQDVGRRSCETGMLVWSVFTLNRATRKRKRKVSARYL